MAFSVGSLFGGGSSNVVTIKDPYKTQVSDALVPYLTSRIGQGLPSYTGKLYEDFDEGTYNNYKNFLSLSPEEWFNKAVAEPETARFKSELLPELREGYAGSLRGSGRYRDEENAMTDFETNLSKQRYNSMIDIPQQQFNLASSYKKLKDLDYMLEYQNWFTSLPENNPVLGQALSYLGVDRGIYMGTNNSNSGDMVDIAKIINGIDLASMLSNFNSGSTGNASNSTSDEILNYKYPSYKMTSADAYGG